LLSKCEALSLNTSAPLQKVKEKEVQMANKYIGKCSTSLAIKDMQMKMTMIFHINSVRKASIKNGGGK
jgi:hypothetical protein